MYNEILYIFKSSLLIKWQGIICFEPNVFAFLKNDIKSPFRAVARMGSYDFVRCRLTISLHLFEPKKQKAPNCVIKRRNDIVSGWKSPFFFAVRGWRKQGKEFVPSCRFIGNTAFWVQKKHLFSCGLFPENKCFLFLYSVVSGHLQKRISSSSKSSVGLSSASRVFLHSAGARIMSCS